YFDYSTAQFLQFEKGKVKGASSKVSQGAGVRANAGEKTGYAFSDEISMKQLETAAASARYIAGHKTPEGIVHIGGLQPLTHNLYPVQKNAMEVPLGVKAELLQKINEICRGYDARIEEVMASIVVEDKKVLIVSREGWMKGDSRPLVRLNVTCVAKDGMRREVGIFGGGGRFEYNKFLEDSFYEHIAREAARIAILNLSAKDAPAGLMPVVLGNGWPGILLHEAVGHGLEGDFNRKKTSAFSGRMGTLVASPLCTVVDDGTMFGRRGSLNIDDEGTPTKRNVLIKDGVLLGYMQDLQNAKLMGAEPTGNGRRESYAHAPMPRMTNTFMLAGDSLPEDIIRSVKRGLYAKNFGGGQVDITNGKFVFSTTEAYMIENGEVTYPVKGATLIGDGPTALMKVSMVGNDLELDNGVGTCGKNGQSVPVGVGIPTLKVDEMTVGGTKYA
ncbi:MAG: metalloprotease TldD, partial [bacterium]|nr:metalloprotease TldD [bacterium]